MPTPKPLTITDLTRHLGVSRWTAYRLLDDGDLPSMPGPRGPVVPIAEYLVWLRSQTVTAKEEGLLPTALQDLPDLIPFEQVAEKYQRSLRMLKEGARAKKFAHVHIGRGRYFTPDQLAAWLAAGTVAAAEDVTKDAMRDRRDRRQTAQRRRPAA